MVAENTDFSVGFVCQPERSLVEAFEALPFASRLETPNGCDPKGGMGGLYFKKCLTESCQGIMSDDAMVMAMAAVR